MNLHDSISSFRGAASQRGKYESQQSAAQQLFLQLELAPVGQDTSTALIELSREIQRFITNISCRIEKRDPRLRPIRADLVKLHRQVRAHARESGVDLSPQRQVHDGNECKGVCHKLDKEGPRHLCKYLCYYHAFEPVRCHASLYYKVLWGSV